MQKIKFLFTAIFFAALGFGFVSCENDNELVSKYNGYNYVDLGLSVKWATCNVGADSPEEYGDYFAWGETKPKLSYSEENYTYKKNPETLSFIRDVATVKMGRNWRMPTIEEHQELIDECTWTWTTLNGVNGYNIEGPNGNSIFLPAAGYRNGSDLDCAGLYGDYWSSSLHTGNSYASQPYDLCFSSGYVSWYVSGRYYGKSVRGVFTK